MPASSPMNPCLIERFPIRRGPHPSREDGLCAMEMVAWLAGEAHSDSPACACPVIAAFVRSFNDLLPDDEARHHHLRAVLPRLVHTAGTRALERRRGYLVADLAVRGLAPRALFAAGRAGDAARLAAGPEIRDRDSARHAVSALRRLQSPRPAIWLAERAASSLPPALWVGAAVRLAKETAGTLAWFLLDRTLEAMLEAGRVDEAVAAVTARPRSTRPT